MIAERSKLVTLLAAALLAVGCLHGPSAVKRDLSQAAGVELDQEFGITLGRVGTWIARQGLKMAPGNAEEEIPVSLEGVRKVSVGIYNVEGRREDGEPARGIRLADFDLGPEWYPLAQIRDEGENVFVLLREADGRIKAMLIAVTDDDEWVLVKIRGNLNRVIEDGLRLGFDSIDRPDLYAATRRERGLDEDPEPPVRYARCDEAL